MKPSKGRQILSWVVGILICIVLFLISTTIIEKMGLSTSFYFEGFENGDYVEEDRFTSLSWFFIVIDIVIASRVAMAIYHGNFKEGIDQYTNLLLAVIIGCLGLYTLINTVIWEMFERELRQNLPPFFYNILNLALIAGIGFFGFVTYQNKKYLRERKEKERSAFNKLDSDDGDHFQ